MFDNYEPIEGAEARAICCTLGLADMDVSQTVQYCESTYPRSITAAGRLKTNGALMVISIEQARGRFLRIVATDYTNLNQKTETVYLQGSGYSLVEQPFDPSTRQTCGAPTLLPLTIEDVRICRADTIQRAGFIFDFVDQVRARRPIRRIPEPPHYGRGLG